MKVYRIKHIPTGLYFCPARKIKNEAGWYAKSNLSKKGKIYHNKPSLKWIEERIYTHQHSVRFKDKTIEAPDEHWVIEEL